MFPFTGYQAGRRAALQILPVAGGAVVGEEGNNIAVVRTSSGIVIATGKNQSADEERNPGPNQLHRGTLAGG